MAQLIDSSILFLLILAWEGYAGRYGVWVVRAKGRGKGVGDVLASTRAAGDSCGDRGAGAAAPAGEQ
jgi:hypothetical protein